MGNLEKQLEMMRTQKAQDGVTKMTQLEAELKALKETRITPAMVNDEETVKLRSTVKKLEDAMVAAERKMEAQRKKVEEERARAAEERRKEEIEFREVLNSLNLNSKQSHLFELLRRPRSVKWSS